MALTMKTTSKTALAKFTVHMKDGKKTTETLWCSRSEAQSLILQMVRSNGISCEYVSIKLNGKPFILN